MKVRADILDISAETPQAKDRILVDTNAWVWLTHAPSAHAVSFLRPHTSLYSQFLRNVKNVGGGLIFSAISLSELAHAIEGGEHQIWSRKKTPTPSKKEFRAEVGERSRVLGVIETSFLQVQSWASEVPVTVDWALGKKVLIQAKRLGHTLDMYDAFLLEAVNTGLTGILTDDSDFASVPGLTVFTANPDILRDAAAQKRVVTRDK